MVSTINRVLLISALLTLVACSPLSTALKKTLKREKKVSSPRVEAITRGNYCGTTWKHAEDCHASCPTGVSTECPSGQSCFASIPCSASATDSPRLSGDSNLYCGTSWLDAVESCAVQCPSGINSECPSGQYCYADISCSGGGGGSSPPTTTPPSNNGTGIPPQDTFVAYYELVWTDSTPLSTATAGIAFNGWVDVDRALSTSAPKYDGLVGMKYISIGGGNANGRWTVAALDKLDAAIEDGRLSEYAGICYDIEEGDSGLAARFEDSFATAKSHGLSVLVTVSHSVPYGFADNVAVMDTILSSGNVDYVSPMLYSNGLEEINDYTAIGYDWDNYANRGPKVVVSITKSSLYDDAVSEFSGIGVSLAGFIVWPGSVA